MLCGVLHFWKDFSCIFPISYFTVFIKVSLSQPYLSCQSLFLRKLSRRLLGIKPGPSTRKDVPVHEKLIVGEKKLKSSQITNLTQFIYESWYSNFTHVLYVVSYYNILHKCLQRALLKQAVPSCDVYPLIISNTFAYC